MFLTCPLIERHQPLTSWSPRSSLTLTCRWFHLPRIPDTTMFVVHVRSIRLWSQSPLQQANSKYHPREPLSWSSPTVSNDTQQYHPAPSTISWLPPPFLWRRLLYPPSTISVHVHIALPPWSIRPFVVASKFPSAAFVCDTYIMLWFRLLWPRWLRVKRTKCFVGGLFCIWWEDKVFHWIIMHGSHVDLVGGMLKYEEHIFFSSEILQLYGSDIDVWYIRILIYSHNASSCLKIEPKLNPC